MKHMMPLLLALLLSLTTFAQGAEYRNSEMVGYIAYTNDNPNCHPIPCAADIIVVEPNTFTFEVYDVFPSGRILSWSPDFHRILEVNIFNDLLYSITMPFGNGNALFESPENIAGARWSPSGNRIALTTRTPYTNESEFFLLDSYGFGFYKMRLEFAAMSNPVWHPFENTLLITGEFEGRFGVWQIDTETQEVTRILETFENVVMPEYSKNGEMLTFYSGATDREYDIYLLNMNPHELQRITNDAQYWYDIAIATSAITPFVYDDTHIIYQAYVNNLGGVLRLQNLHTGDFVDLTEAKTESGYDLSVANFAVSPSGNQIVYFTWSPVGIPTFICIIDLAEFDERCEQLASDSGYIPYSWTRLSWGR